MTEYNTGGASYLTTYGYNNTGNVTSLADTINSSQKRCFQYDYLNRLTAAFTALSSNNCTAYSSVGIGGYNLSYAYDAIGNMTTKDSTPLTYGDANHKHAVSAAFGNSYSYDANGNQTTRNIVGILYTLTYDYENRAQWAPAGISGGSTSATFVYDAAPSGHPNRVKSTVNGVTTVLLVRAKKWLIPAELKNQC